MVITLTTKLVSSMYTTNGQLKLPASFNLDNSILDSLAAY